MFKFRQLSLLLIIFISSYVSAQQVNIISQLKKVEAGRIGEVKEELARLKLSNPGNPNVIFLEAVITEDGEKAQAFYAAVYSNFPKSQFADAALFRNFSYYYALGLYKKAEELKSRLRKDYPNSPYLKNTLRSFPISDEMLIVNPNPYKIKNTVENRFTIQVGAFGQYDNAVNLKNKFDADGVESNISPKRVNNLQLHIVTVGNFANRPDAESYLITLDKKYGLKGRVIKID
jgi:hypothetical protein